MLPNKFYCNDKFAEFEIMDSENSPTAYVILWVDWLTTFGLEKDGVWLLPWRWHILSCLLIAGRGIRAEICGLDDVFPPDELCSRLETLCYHTFICAYAFFIRVLVIGGLCTYTGSVVQYWRSCTPSQFIGRVLGSARFMCWMPLVVYFGFTNCVLLLDNKTNTRMIVIIGTLF